MGALLCGGFLTALGFEGFVKALGSAEAVFAVVVGGGLLHADGIYAVGCKRRCIGGCGLLRGRWGRGLASATTFIDVATAYYYCHDCQQE
jgi:hypothetical protein